MQPKKSKRTLSIDVGLRRIGLAISDMQKIIASPLENIEGFSDVKKTVSSVVHFIEKLSKEKGYEIDEIVVGLPLKMNGTSSDITDHVKQFAALLQEKVTYTVHLFDERLTSVQAERSLMEGNFTRKKRAQFVDRVSAVLLLQSFLTSRPNTLL